MKLTKQEAELLRAVVRDLRRAENNLGSVEGSYGWNEAYFKVEALSTEFHNMVTSLTEVSYGQK